MSVSIHPHKGYLNTKFNVYVLGNTQTYSVYEINDINGTPIISGKVEANTPHTINFEQPGDFTVVFEDGETKNIQVEDGYKFGGSKLKRTFIFDDCPWCFVVMNDRTYFYNRDTNRGYVESISPDVISKVSSRYVLLENNGQAERTLYDLDDEMPVLCVSDILTYTEKVLVWKECNDTKKELCVISLDSKELDIDRYAYDDYTLDDKKQMILFYKDKNVYKFSIKAYDGVISYTCSQRGSIVGVVSPNIAILYNKQYYANYIIIYELNTSSVLRKIELDGDLAGINGKELIDLFEKRKALNAIDVEVLQFPELKLSAKYYRVQIFTCDWDIFYIVNAINLVKDGTKSVDRIEESTLFSINTNIEEEISFNPNKCKFIVFKDVICLDNGNECFTIRKDNLDSDKIKDGSVYCWGGFVYLYSKNVLYRLNQYGYWDFLRKENLDFGEFEEFGVVKNKTTNKYESIEGFKLGGNRKSLYGNVSYIETDNTIIFPKGRRLQSKPFVDILAQSYLQSRSESISFSESHFWGIIIKEGKVFICHLKNGRFIKVHIMQDIFDVSEYNDVLLSEDGSCILHRDKDKAIILNIKDGSTQSFDNMPYIKHINGIRPLFCTPSSLQPVLINPVSGQHLDCYNMTQYQFISPSGEYYADTNLKEYVEYYDRKNQKLISREEYFALIKKYTYPPFIDRDSIEWQKVYNARKKLILDNITF